MPTAAETETEIDEIAAVAAEFVENLSLTKRDTTPAVQVGERDRQVSG